MNYKHRDGIAGYKTLIETLHSITVIEKSCNHCRTQTSTISSEVHRKTDTLFPGNNMTVDEPEPLTIRSGGTSSNHYATLPP